MWLLTLYPRAWRDRYESEVRVVLEEHRVRLATLADLVAGAVDARLDPAYRSEERIMSRSSRGPYLRCSFCGKGQDQVQRLVAGPGVFICDRCVELCNEVLADGGGPPPGPDPCPTPAPRRDRLRPWEWLRHVLRSTAAHAT